jgi:hypothetical protein
MRRGAAPSLARVAHDGARVAHPVAHRDISACLSLIESIDLQAVSKAGEGSRTPDLLFTRQVLYQLSYSGESPSLGPFLAAARLPGSAYGKRLWKRVRSSQSA